MKGISSYVAILIIFLMITILMVYIDYQYNASRPAIFGDNPTSVVFDDDVMDVLNNGFQTYTEHEFAVCLYGYRHGDILYLDSYTIPDQQPIENGLIIAPCTTKPGPLGFLLSLFEKKEVYGSVHNHVNGVCRPSETDLFTFGKSHDAIMGIICGTNTVVVYTPDSLSESIPVSVQEL